MIDNIEPIKRGRGRPPISEAEKKQRRRLYENKYQNNRYKTDPEYKEKKKQRALMKYRNTIKTQVPEKDTEKKS
jgi:hypothetical protein